jgi:glycosyltransferase involved in cell wall biosynthesis
MGNRRAAEKAPDRAIRIARACGIPLRIAAKVDKADQHYFDAVIRPMLDCPGVEMIGEISDREKPAFLSGAIGLLMPIDWPEPFGLVMIEAMSCGTPVRRGTVAIQRRDGDAENIRDLTRWSASREELDRRFELFSG